MYIRHETRHFRQCQFRDNWGGSSSNEGGSSSSSSGAGEGSTGGGGGTGLGGIGSADSGAYGGVSQSLGGGWGGGNIADANQSAAETARLAALNAATSAPSASDWDRFVANSPSVSTAAKLAFGIFTNPIIGTINAIRYNAQRLEGMSAADIENERAIQREIADIRASHDTGKGGAMSFGGLQFGNGKSFGTVSSAGAISGGTSAAAGSIGSGAAVSGAATGGAASGSAGAGAGGGIIVAGESPLAKLAALATIGALAYQLMG